MKNILCLLAALFLLCHAPQAQAAVDGAAHPEEQLFQGGDDDDDSAQMQTGSWSASAAKAADSISRKTAQQAGGDDAAAGGDDDTVQTGSWSADTGTVVSPAPARRMSARDRGDGEVAGNPPGTTTATAPAYDGVSETGHLVVTSVQGCYDKLSPEQADDIRMHYPKPYEECLRRVDEMQSEKQTWRDKKAASASAGDTAETPRNFQRVKPSK